MSYDLSILGRVPGSSVRKFELKEQLTKLGWRADSENHFVLQGTKGQCADLDLAWLENGACSEPGDTVNQIQVHVPYALLESLRSEILTQCLKLAEGLDWRLYDEQEGKFLR